VSASHGIFSLGYHPSVVQTQSLSTPKAPKRLFGKLAAKRVYRVPPSCFLSISTVYSNSWLQVYFTLKTTMGFITFPVSPRVVKRRRIPPFPQRGSYPPKNSPYQQPYRITAALTFLPLLRTLLPSCYRSCRSTHCFLQYSKLAECRLDVPPITR